MEIIKPKEINILKSVILTTGSALSLSLMALFIKLALPQTTAIMLVFSRAIFGFLYILAMIFILYLRGYYVSLKTNNWKIHALRSLTVAGSLYALYYSLRYIPLVDANLLVMTYPLFAMILAAIFFKEKIKFLSGLAIVIAFVGIVMILKPGNELFDTASLLALVAGICTAVSVLGIRKMNKHEHTYSIMLYYILATTIISTVLVILNWHTPNRETLILLLGVGITGILYQEFLTRALSYAPTAIPSALMYLSVIFSTIFSLVIWNHSPGMLSWIGIFLVCLGNIIVVILR